MNTIVKLQNIFFALFLSIIISACASSTHKTNITTKAEMIAEDLTMCENIQLNENLSIKTSDFAKNILNGKTSTNPNDSLLARWGLAPKYSTEESRKCPESFEQKPEDDGLPGEQ